MENEKQTKHRKKHRCKKVVLQIAMACALLCSVVRWMPDMVLADNLYDSSQNSNHYIYTYSTTIDNKPYSVTYDLQGTSPIYLVEHRSKIDTYYYFVSLESWTGSKKVVDDGKSRSFAIRAYSNRCNKFGSFYQSAGDSSIAGNPPRWVWDADKYNSESDAGKTDACTGENYQLHFNAKLIYAKNKYDLGDMVWETGEGVKGTKDNPIEDEDIGCPVISKKLTGDLTGVEAGNSGSGGSLHVGDTQLGDNVYYDDGGVSNGGDGVLCTFSWKNKTTTGFSLNSNKYARTYMQIRVQNRSVIYNDLAHTKVKYKLDSYGESSLVYDALPVGNKPLEINLSSKTFLKNNLPNYYNEIHTAKMLSNTLFLGNRYAFQFRIICTNDLAVIPSDTAKWHCGRWTEVTTNADVLEKDDDDQKTGDIDDNGNFVQNEDDTTTKIDDSSSGQYDNKDDYKDTVENGSNKGKDLTNSFGWSDFKNLINQCKQVPELIKGIFSFLPDWVLAFVGIGFGIWIFVLIKRAVV